MTAVGVAASVAAVVAAVASAAEVAVSAAGALRAAGEPAGPQLRLRRVCRRAAFGGNMKARARGTIVLFLASLFLFCGNVLADPQLPIRTSLVVDVADLL